MPNLPILWDARTLKDHAQAATERAQDAQAEQAEQDWNSAEIYAERIVSDLRKRFAICPLPACRRARGCRGNPTICLPPSASKAAEASIEDIYLQIQQQRRAAAWRRRRVDVLVPVIRKLPRGR
ncbi:hypothetical protein [Bradyrhizobium sp.]|jgi:hypothetical protein|uniref:hypothetical protein n=1 Tax=Bradyrhizobium sp. TaxID=376 RepID=UPI002E09E686|nr:hypothetical protein [Bradyrhizobium sp.]